MTVRMLIVDDEPELLEVMGEVLAELGHEVITVPTASRALEVLAHTPIDVLIADVVMPGIDGPTLVRQARVCSPSTAAVLVSGQVTEAADEAERAGAFFLAKPFKVSALVEVLERALARRHLPTRDG